MLTNARTAPAATPSRRSRIRTALWASAAAAVLTVTGCAILTFPVTTRQGVNFELATHRLPLYGKALQFLDRSVQYQQIADEITAGAVSDADRALKVFDWTRRQIRRTPDGWPVVDDHILHIIIRGHGVADQHADVFATLATYAGVRAFWGKARMPDPDGPGVILSFAHIDGRWRVFDVFNDIVFRQPTGELATMDDLRAHPDLVPEAARSLMVGGVSYGDIVTRASMPLVPSPLRAELQMPSVRLWYELKLAVRLESAHESE